MANPKRRLRSLDEFDRSDYASLSNVSGGVRRNTVRWITRILIVLTIAAVVGGTIGYLSR